MREGPRDPADGVRDRDRLIEVAIDSIGLGFQLERVPEASVDAREAPEIEEDERLHSLVRGCAGTLKVLLVKSPFPIAVAEVAVHPGNVERRQQDVVLVAELLEATRTLL